MFEQERASQLFHFLPGGEGGIRTHESVSALAAFKAAPIVRSGTSPKPHYNRGSPEEVIA